MQIKKYFTYTAALTLLCALTSCEDIYSGAEEKKMDVPVQLKAVVVPFDSNNPETLRPDAGIGMMMLHSDDSSVRMADNLRLVPDADGILSGMGDLRYPADASKVDFICYGPYADLGQGASALKVDVSTPLAAKASDYIYAVNRNKFPSLTPVKMQMAHILAKATFTITRGEGISDTDLTGLQLMLRNVPDKADFDLVKGEFTNEAFGAPVNIEVTDGGAMAGVLMIPFSSDNFELVCRVKGLEFSKRLGKIEFASGNLYAFNLEVSEPGFELSLDYIDDWEVEEY